MKSPLNILIVSFDWNDEVRNRPDFFLAKLERDHLESKQNNFLFYSWGKGKYEKELTPHVRVVRQPAPFRFFRPLYDFLSSFAVASFLEHDAFVPDLVLVYDFPMAAALSGYARKKNIPLILALTNMPTTYIEGRRSPLLIPKLLYQRMMERIAIPKVSGVYTINEATKAYAISHGVSEDRIMIFTPDTIARDKPYIEAADKSFIRTHHAIPSDHRIILSVGRLEGEKGFDVLIDAFSKLPDKKLTLVILGKGPLKESLTQQAVEKGVENRIIFPGAISRELIWNYFKGADVFILLSLAEALGLVVWEAMVADTPVIGSHAGGIKESIGRNEERGFLWKKEDGIPALSERLEKAFARDQDVREKMARAKRYVEEQLHNSTTISDLYARVR
jgi:glycosyltransferase involved in cell wall biosynthesis